MPWWVLSSASSAPGGSWQQSAALHAPHLEAQLAPAAAGHSHLTQLQQQQRQRLVLGWALQGVLRAVRLQEMRRRHHSCHLARVAVACSATAVAATA
jgi:hypothetical protein